MSMHNLAVLLVSLESNEQPEAPAICEEQLSRDYGVRVSSRVGLARVLTKQGRFEWFAERA